MRTGIKYHALKDISLVEARTVLAGAIAFHFQKGAIARDLLGRSVAALSSAKVVGMKATKAPDESRIKAALQARYKYSTPDDNPILMDHISQVIEYVHENMPEQDLGFLVAFDEVDMRASNVDNFDLRGTSLGLTWAERKPGEQTLIRRKVSEDEINVKLIEFSEGLGLLDRWIDYQQFWNIDEAVAEFQATYWDKMADLHYGLLTALGAGVNEAFATDDVTTANNAAGTIIRGMRGKGRGVSQNTELVAICAIEHVGRLEKMLTAQRGSAIVDQGTVSQPLTARISTIVGTTKVPSNSTGYYLGLPGRKNKHGRWKDLTIESTRNAYASAEDIVGVGQYNAVIGDQTQWRRVLFA